MYGHADSALTPCAVCPAWQPRWAAAIFEDGTEKGVPVCKSHAITLIPDYAPLRAVTTIPRALGATA